MTETASTNKARNANANPANVSPKDGKLVVDIGVNNGDDTAYYLSMGYRVLGIEANPVLAEECNQRFAKEIAEGRCTILNVGVLKEPGEFTFYSCIRDHGKSSFEPPISRKESEWEELKIQCVTTRQLIAEYGQPFFMKVDIEGSDIQTILSLSPDIAPPYVSLELNYADPIVEKLIELGYTSFKFVNGGTYRPNPPIFQKQVGWRMLRKVGRAVPLVRKAISALPESMHPYSEYESTEKYSPDGYGFTRYSSGPFGEQAAGKWMSPAKAVEWYLALKEHYRQEGKEHAIWWDVHARHSSVK